MSTIQPNSILCGDCLSMMQAMPTGFVRLVLTSPPYEDARLYKPLAFKARGQGWVDFMLPRVVEACRVCDGLVLVNMAGKVRDFKYSPVVEWLVTDLTRSHGIVCGPAPYVFHRVGIPGSGGPHYHRRDWEPVYAFARPECLPLKWSDNTAMGHPPKWAPGGEMSYRLASGARVNQWGMSFGQAKESGVNGAVSTTGKPRPSHKQVSTRPERNEAGSRQSHLTADRITKAPGKDGAMELQGYHAPPIANPGNLIQENYTADEVAELLAIGSDVGHHLSGGGHMGDDLAHENEAPFPQTLAEFFVCSYCPEDGITLDPFSGSGTVAKVAQRWGRKYIGIDVRQSQVALAEKRLKEHGHPLFA